MSEENVEIVRRIMEAFERRDTKASFAPFDPAVVWDASRIPDPMAGVYHGHEGIREFWRQWLGSFEAHGTHVETLIDAGDNVVLGLRLGGRGKTSGAAVEMRRWAVYRIRNGLVIHVGIFETEAEALKAAGLQE